MQIIRFYSQSDILEPLAKYRADEDRPVDDVKAMCRDLVAGIHDTQDVVEFLNIKFAILDKGMPEKGWARMEMIDPANLDAKCAMTFDVVIDSNAKVVKMFTFDVKPTSDEPFYLKSLNADSTFTLGALIQ